MSLNSAVVVGLAVALGGCNTSRPLPTTSAPTPLFINPLPNPLPDPLPIPSALPPEFFNGTAIWNSIETSHVLCNEITKQVGDSWRIRLGMSTSGNLVRVSIWEGPPDWDPPAQFDGTREGDSITAVRNNRSPLALACPRDIAGTPQTGGDLSMKISGSDATGKYTEVYGTGADRVTFYFSFGASIE